MVSVGLDPNPEPVCTALVSDEEYVIVLVPLTSAVPPPVIDAADELLLVHWNGRPTVAVAAVVPDGSMVPKLRVLPVAALNLQIPCTVAVTPTVVVLAAIAWLRLTKPIAAKANFILSNFMVIFLKEVC